MKNLKGWLVAILALALLVLSVMGWHWTDVANSPFWWTAWIIIAIASAAGLILLIRWIMSNWRKLKQ